MEELSGKELARAEPYLDVLGEELCQKLFSKSWQYREEGLREVSKEYPKLGKSAIFKDKSPEEIFLACFGITAELIQD